MKPFDPKLAAIAADAKVKTCHAFHLWHAMKQLGQSFRRDIFANFAGLEVRHVDAMIAAMEAHDAYPKTAETKSKTRGTRLPNDFVPPPSWAEWAIQVRRWSEEDTKAELDEFCRYWQSRADSAAVKLDWYKTWQNRCAQSRRPDGHNNQNGGQADRQTELKARIAHWERHNGAYHEETEQVKAWRAELAAMSNVVPLRAISGS